MGDVDYGREHERRMSAACEAALFAHRCGLYRFKEFPDADGDLRGVCGMFTHYEKRMGPRGGSKRVLVQMYTRNLSACPRNIHSVKAGEA